MSSVKKAKKNKSELENKIPPKNIQKDVMTKNMLNKKKQINLLNKWKKNKNYPPKRKTIKSIKRTKNIDFYKKSIDFSISLSTKSLKKEKSKNNLLKIKKRQLKKPLNKK